MEKLHKKKIQDFRDKGSGTAVNLLSYDIFILYTSLEALDLAFDHWTHNLTEHLLHRFFHCVHTQER